VRAVTGEAGVLAADIGASAGLAHAPALIRPSGTYIGDIHVADPSSGYAVQIGNPADLSPGGRRKQQSRSPSARWGGRGPGQVMSTYPSEDA
jgi:hypothetical protein